MAAKGFGGRAGLCNTTFFSSPFLFFDFLTALPIMIITALRLGDGNMGGMGWLAWEEECWVTAVVDDD